ncbi:SipW-dependent-type signal peptide-containing protein, partial [Dysosmobacter sp.]|uniref:SipW-dependent-type signal peptide-containing protein n=1 Tax=Dysosmobacter sp. TaxID=2591382 RepID=UPI002A8E1BD3
MRKKIVALSMAVLMLAVCVIGGTLAYFTDQTETKVNTFTVGNVNIELTEPQWNENDNHNLMPGTSYAKDPTITVGEKSQDAYVFLKMDMNK